MGTQFAGAWKRATLPISKVPLKPGIDPQHAQPTDPPDPSFFDYTGAPLLPLEWADGQYEQANVPSAFVDQTPVDHMHGLGFLPGVDLETAQYLGGRARNEDLGNMDARDYERPQYQEDGSTHGVIINGRLEGDSPGDLQYDLKGVGVPLDPYARSNTHITHRPTGPATYDMRWYGEQMRPRYVHTAEGSAPATGPVPNRTHLQPDSGRGAISRPDNWAAPVVRRSAADWGQAFSTAAETPVDSSGDFGLGSWGL